MFLGVDTSCYTTSLSLVKDNQIIFDKRIPIKVKSGSVGIRQSEAFFQHVGNLSEIYKELSASHCVQEIMAIGVSATPRRVEGSYMPVFSAGVHFANNIANTLEIPLYEFSHQEGHIFATSNTSNINLVNDSFITVHISGGTTEILRCNFAGERTIEIAGGTKDISFGQLIDRIGVYTGIGFPSGRIMEERSEGGKVVFRLPDNNKSSFVNLSGLENYVKKNIDDFTYDLTDIYYSLFMGLSRILIRMLDRVLEVDTCEIVLTGGVSSNSLLVSELTNYYEDKNIKVVNSKKYSTDNSVGISYLTQLEYMEVVK